LFVNQQNKLKQDIAGTRVQISLLPAYSTILFSFRIKHTASNSTLLHDPELSRHHVTCIKQRLVFQDTPDNQHNLVRSLWASFHYIPLHDNANAWDTVSFSTPSDGTNGQPQRKGKGNCQGKNIHIGDKPTLVIGSGL